MTRPSFCGFNPKSPATIAFSISLIVVASYGRIKICCGSGVPMLANCFSGVSEP